MQDFLPLLHDLCKKYHIDFPTMAAICDQESSWDPYATQYEPRYTYLVDVQSYAKLNRITMDTEKVFQMTSWGLAQLMGGNARSFGFKGPLMRLCEPEIGLEYACKFFKDRCDKYPELDKKIASYNRGSPIYARGKLKNQEYVDKVVDNMKKYED